MADALEVHVTMPDKERATALARALVDEGLAACVNIVPGEEEVLCLIKTRHAVFDRARDRILALHPYEVPEILAFAVDDGSATYLEWLKNATP